MGRGPSYPFVSLEDAVSLAAKVYQFSRRTAVHESTVLKEALGYSLKSSSGIKIIAALKAFGLLDEVSLSSGKSIRISDRCYRILIDEPDSEERKVAIREAAFAPRWYAYCWEKWGADVPPAARSTLIINHGFIPTTVDGFLADYKKTIAYARVGSPLRHSEEEDAALSDATNDAPPPPVENASVPAQQPSQAATSQLRTDVFSLDEGQVTISWPNNLSRESVEDVKDWIALLLRKLERSVSKAEGSE